MNKTTNTLLMAGAGAALMALGYKVYQKRQDHKLEQALLSLNQYLDQSHAQERKNMVQGYIDYDLTLLLAKGSLYSGVVQISLCLSSSQDLFLDYEGSNIKQVVINGKAMTQTQLDSRWNHHFLILPSAMLCQGHNKITLMFQNAYCTDGEGLHSMVDTDGQQYIYSNLEPAYCRKWFPCLDQPDLKASLKLTTLVPQDWVAISNEIVVDKAVQVDLARLDDLSALQISLVDLPLLNQDLSSFRLWSFMKSKYISTYLMAVCTGPYQEIRSHHSYKNIPMSLWCRQSCYHDLHKQQHIYFETTNKCMAFYEEFFQQPFVFSKYDHVFCPQFNCGAMEHPGCVTVNDSYIFKDKVSKGTRSHLVTMVAHELCHMWFGNYVTMAWWDGLWLNESFADFLSYYACEQFSLSFDSFDFGSEFNDRKGWGYTTDMSNATHAIAGPVLDTRQAESIFDGITYSKGSATLKQMLFLLGPQRFSDALGKYFSQYGYGNTTLDDFIAALASQFDGPFTLDQWKQDWLVEPGCNALEAQWLPDGLSIKQTSVITKFNTLRNHKIKIALFSSTGNTKILDVMVEKAYQTMVPVDDIDLYEAVLLNYDDYDFVKILIDNKSQSFFLKHLNKVGSPLNQKLVVRALFEQVKDGQLNADSFMDFVEQNQDGLQDDILSSMMSFLQGTIYHYSPLSKQPSLHQRAYSLIKKQLYLSQPGHGTTTSQDRVTCLTNSLLSHAESQEHVQEVVQWYQDGTLPQIDFPLSYYNKWAVVRLAMRSDMDHSQKQQLLQHRLSQDDSDKALQEQAYCESVLASSPQELENLWSLFLEPKDEPLQIVAKKMDGFNHHRRPLQDYHQKFFDVLPHVYKNQSYTQANTFLSNLFPITDDFPMLIHNLEKLIAQIDPTTQPTYLKKLQEKLDYVKRRQVCCSQP